MKLNAVYADMKRIAREPILMILMFVPLLTLAVLKALVLFGVPLLREYLDFDLEPWYGYVVSTGLLIGPCMLGTVAAFVMIDDRDEGMTNLMAVTPNGYSGYVANRLFLPFILCIAYTFAGYLMLDIFFIPFWKLMYIALLTGIESIAVGLLLMSMVDNKVKGLTYAKGMSGLMLAGLADLLDIKAVSVVSGFIPFYWIPSLAIKQDTMPGIILPLVVHLAWAALAIYAAARRQRG